MISVVLDWCVISCSWVGCTNECWPKFHYSWWEIHHPTMIPHWRDAAFCLCVVMKLSDKNAALFLYGVKILGDGYADDKDLSSVSLRSFIMRARWLDFFFSILKHTTHVAHDTIWFVDMICWFIDGLYHGVSHPGYLQSWQNICVVTKSMCRDKIYISWHPK